MWQQNFPLPLYKIWKVYVRPFSHNGTSPALGEVLKTSNFSYQSESLIMLDLRSIMTLTFDSKIDRCLPLMVGQLLLYKICKLKTTEDSIVSLRKWWRTDKASAGPDQVSLILAKILTAYKLFTYLSRWWYTIPTRFTHGLTVFEKWRISFLSNHTFCSIYNFFCIPWPK